MNGVGTIFRCLCFATVLVNIVHAGDSNDTLRIDVSKSVALYIGNDEASVKLKLSSLVTGHESEERGMGRLRFQNMSDLMKRFGMAMMMAPMFMQLMLLPSALASIKLSLLRSIFVGKLAIAVLLFNLLKNSQKSEVVLVHKPEYHYNHYYDTYHEPEDDDEGWVGR
ncbi:uncharacterized protein LOC108627586 [Ceratina calcarata]|uniref:Uncharacterized protein LOC108627586 n=1 Tax=Ceratina calcarata TaxID=156304 RepID=A0AAJ7J4N4_9HYME|nr:uncharacterized protein LOC108627586 [Ceratina calcarata]